MTTTGPEGSRLLRLLRGSAGIAVAVVVMNVGTYAFQIVSARMLGPGQYGAVASMMALLLVLAVVLARRRPRMTAWAGGGAAVGGVLLVLGLGVGERVFVNTLEGTPFEKASQVFYDQLLKFLYNGAYSLILLGIIVFVVGLYMCGARWAVELRASVNNLADDIAGTIPAGPITSSGAWVAANARWLRVAVAALFVIIVVIGNDLSIARTIWASVISLILLAVVQVWAAAGRRTPVEQVSA